MADSSGALATQRAARRCWEAVSADGHNASIRLAKRLHEGDHEGSSEPYCYKCLWRARACLVELGELAREANR